MRGEGSILDAIKQPDLAAEITLQPVRRYGVDAAVLYSDIVVPAARRRLRHRRRARAPARSCRAPLRTAADLDRLRPLEPEADTPYVAETVELAGRRARRRCRCWPSPARRSPSPAT